MRPGYVHDQLRKNLSDTYKRAKKLVETSIEQYAQKNDGNVVGLSIWTSPADADAPQQETPIFSDLYERINQLMDRNGSLVNLRKRYVSSELQFP